MKTMAVTFTELVIKSSYVSNIYSVCIAYSMRQAVLQSHISVFEKFSF